MIILNLVNGDRLAVHVEDIAQIRGEGTLARALVTLRSGKDCEVKDRLEDLVRIINLVPRSCRAT